MFGIALERAFEWMYHGRVALHTGVIDVNAVRLHVESRCIRTGRFVRLWCCRGWSGYALGSVVLQNRPAILAWAAYGGLAAAVLGLVALFLDRAHHGGGSCSLS